MPEKAVLITALIMERPLCMDCLVARSLVPPTDIEASLLQIRRVLELRRVDEERCRTCGNIGPVLYLERPSGS
jgi:hypothetical protein